MAAGGAGVRRILTSSVLKSGAASLGFRALTLAGKLALVLVLARLFPTELLGLYGLVTTTLGVALLLLSFGFNSYSAREILARSGPGRLASIRDQVVFHGLVYAVVLPGLVLVFVAGVLPWSLLGWFYALLVLEHLAQESFVLFITLSRPAFGHFVSLLRSGAWVPVALALAMLLPAGGLTWVWAAWTAGGILAVLATLRALRGLGWRRALAQPVDWDWIQRGVRTSSLYLGEAIAYSTVALADRYVVEFFLGRAPLGVFVLFANVAGMIQVVVVTALVQVLMPKLIGSYQSGNLEEYRSQMRRMAGSVTLGAVAMAAVAVAAMPSLLRVIAKAEFTGQIGVFWLLVAGEVGFCLALIPHYALYVRRGDRAILGATAVAGVVNVALAVLWVPSFGLAGAAWASLVGVVLMLVLKSAALFTRAPVAVPVVSVRSGS